MDKFGKLYIVATPIGNLEDITLRAIRVLKEVDLILCEDTRVTKKLLDRYEIQKPLLSYHHHSKLSRVEKIVEHLENGKNLALVSDAGTPGISDPGNILIEHITQNMEQKVDIIPIPGASAITTLASVAGINMSKFCFLGFPPHKKGRMKFLADIDKCGYPVIVFESKYRILKLLNELGGLGGCERIRLIIGRELTKQFEEIVRGDIESTKKHFQENKKATLGEFIVVIYKEK
ncbi:MAG: 16S rRNA (cytidine(1402)-2'-O)-methyltransferase [Candidatus Moraniibacteriota bacterium]